MSVFETWKAVIPEDFSDSSRVWIYQSNRMFTMGEALQIEPMLENFTANWQSHGAVVKGYANLIFGQFIVLMADESATGVSGCSTDSSVRLVKQIEQQFGVNLFDRMLLAFLRKDKVEVIPMNQFSHALAAGLVSPDTIYFNNTVLTKEALLQNWLIPVKDSWLKQKIALV